MNLRFTIYDLRAVRLAILFSAFCLLPSALLAAGTNFFSTYPNSATLEGSDLFIVQHADNPGTFNIEATQIPAALGLQSAAFTSSSAYDAAGLAVSVTNGFPWGSLYDPAGAAHSATNGFPWGSLYDPAGTALNSTNGLWVAASGIFSTLTQLNFLSNHINAANLFGLVPTANLGSGTANNTTFLRGDQTWGTPSGSGTVTSVDVAQQGMTSSGALTTSGTITLTQTANKDYLGFGVSNSASGDFTNTLVVGGGAILIDPTNTFQVNAKTRAKAAQVDTNGVFYANGAGISNINPANVTGLVALTNVTANSHIKFTSDTNFTTSEDATGYTNTVPWSNVGTATNLTASFSGTPQSLTVTNGPDVFFSYAGLNGSCSYRIKTNVTLHFAYQPKWLAGSNNVITNGVLSFTSYGGTNAADIEAAMGENQ